MGSAKGSKQTGYLLPTGLTQNLMQGAERVPLLEPVERLKFSDLTSSGDAVPQNW